MDVDVLNDYGYWLKDLFELKTDGVKCINLINLNRGNVGSSSLIVELASLKKCISAMCDTIRFDVFNSGFQKFYASV